jgi:hypothetical protein
MDPAEKMEDAVPEQEATTRRRFLGGAGRKALYITPAVLTLAAQQACASGGVCGSAYKHTVGSPCSENGELEKRCCPQDLTGQNLTCTDVGGGRWECQHDDYEGRPGLPPKTGPLGLSIPPARHGPPGGLRP